MTKEQANMMAGIIFNAVYHQDKPDTPVEVTVTTKNSGGNLFIIGKPKKETAYEATIRTDGDFFVIDYANEGHTTYMLIEEISQFDIVPIIED